eukprot:353582_1
MSTGYSTVVARLGNAKSLMAAQPTENKTLQSEHYDDDSDNKQGEPPNVVVDTYASKQSQPQSAQQNACTCNKCNNWFPITIGIFVFICGWIVIIYIAEWKLGIMFSFGVVVGAAVMWPMQSVILNKKRERDLAKPPGKIYENIGIFHGAYLQAMYDIEGAMKDKSVWDPFMEMDTKMVYTVSMGDDELSEPELKALYKMQSIYGMTDDQITTALNKCKEKPISMEYFKQMFESKPFSQTAFKMGRSPSQHATCALLSGLEIADADGIDREEFESAKEIGNSLGLSDERMNKLLHAVYLERSLLKLYGELL